MNKIEQYAIIPPRLSPSHNRRSKIFRLMRNTPHHILPVLLVLLGVAMLAAPVTGCVYRVDVQQGNLLEEKEIEAVKVGMTRSQVRFLLGTPAVADPFHENRWDYIYYFRQGRRRTADRAWLIVLFEDDRVSEIQRDVPVEPT